MPLIPDDLIDEIQTRMDIAELIGRYVPLKRAGRHFKAACPFHQEKTPSFMVNTEKQIFHCFGCGVGGNIFSFLMQYERMTFPEAVRQLAEHVGVRVPDPGTSQNGVHERLRALMEKVCAYYERTLTQSEQGRAARAYVRARSVSEETCRRFRLGCAPAGWNRLLSTALGTGVAVRDLEAAGLVIRGRNGYYDRFRDRLIFPITDVRGRVVGFGGRSLEGQDPKYLNSPETPLYTKGRHLFGLTQAKAAILEQKRAVVVEGYFDCVRLVDGGFPNVVSPLGTALTAEQARLLRRFAETVVLAFDPDAAGEEATLRGIDLLVEAGLTVRVAQLPAGVDPDECLRTVGPAGLKARVDHSLGIMEFLIEQARKRYPVATTEGRVQAAQFILPSLAMVPNAMLRSEYVRLVAEGLTLDEAAVTQELTKTPRRSVLWAGTPAARSAAPRAGGAGAELGRAAWSGPEGLLTALILDEPSRWAAAQQEAVTPEAMSDARLRRILEVVRELVAGSRSPTAAQVVSRLSEEGHGALVTELVEVAQSVDAKEAAFRDCLRRVRATVQQRALGALRDEIQTAQERGAEADLRRLLTRYQRQVKGG